MKAVHESSELDCYLSVKSITVYPKMVRRSLLNSFSLSADLRPVTIERLGPRCGTIIHSLREAELCAKLAVVVFRECIKSFFHFMSSAWLRYAQKFQNQHISICTIGHCFLFTCVKAKFSA